MKTESAAAPETREVERTAAPSDSTPTDLGSVVDVGLGAHVGVPAHAAALSRLSTDGARRPLASGIARGYGNRHLARVLQLARIPDLLAGTHAAAEKEHADVEAVLHPGSTVVVTPPAAVGGKATVTVKAPPTMTGAGKGGAFEKEMLKALETAVAGWAKSLRDLKKAGPPAFPIAQANDIARAAQEEVEKHFGSLIRVATREIGDLYHPGSFDLSTVLGDQSTRPLNDGSRQGWTRYWMTLKGVGQEVLNKFNVLGDRDSAEFTRVLQEFALDPARRTDIDDAIHSWPAEAGTATVFIQPFVDPDPAKRRPNRWDLFTTLIHEMMHKVAHPNFQRAAQAIGGTAQKYMTEGFADLMRHDLWDGPAGLEKRLAGPAAAPLRKRVEGGTFPYDKTMVVYHSDYSEIAQAREIAAKVGMANCKAAFFLGHTELLGIGAGTGATTPLAGISQWQATDAEDADIYVMKAGDSIASIQKMTAIMDWTKITTEAGGSVDAPWKPTAGARLRVPGIRHVWAIQGDTLDAIAQQNGVTVAALVQANGYAAGTPGATVLAAGKRLLIPVRTP